MKNILNKCKNIKLQLLTIFFAFAAIVQVVPLKNQETGGYFLWALGLGMGILTVKKYVPLEKHSWIDCVLPRFLLLIAAVLLGLAPQITSHWGVFVLMCCLYAYNSDWKLTLKLSLVCFIFAVCLPRISYFYLLFSFPLSEVSSILTSGVLNLLGIESSCSHNIIYVNNSRIAITAACSGIELFEAMLFLGWVAVCYEHKQFWIRVMHYVTLLPLIVFFNTLRLTIVVLLSRQIGDAAFFEPWHTLLGYGVLLGTMISFYLLGKIFKVDEKK